MLRAVDPHSEKAKVAFLSAHLGFRAASTPIEMYDARRTDAMAAAMKAGRRHALAAAGEAAQSHALLSDGGMNVSNTMPVHCAATK